MRCFLILVLAATCAQTKLVTISNVVPRRDTNNAILDAHDSKVNFHNGLYYWHAASYGNCTEPAGNSGCANSAVGSCGFQTNHNVTLYTSPDLVTWTNMGVAFGAAGNLPPQSVLFAPKTVYNRQTQQWVMWYNYITGSFSNSFYGVATSAVPEGPFAVVNSDVKLQFADNGDEGLFVDDDGTAYVIYTTLSKGHAISIEKLSPDYTTSLGVSSGLFGDTFVEAPALFRRQNTYYALFGPCCCYCESGSIVNVYTAAAPLGPYTKQNALAAPKLAAPVANGTITVLSAIYGANCGVHDDLTSLAGAACNGQANCTWGACICGTPQCENPQGCVPDPAYGCAKDLQVTWQCSGDDPSAGPRSRRTPPEANGAWAGVSCFPEPPAPPQPFGSQQTDVFMYLDSNGEQQFMYVGDHWQSAPDQLKSHDFTVFAPLIFDAAGNITTPGFLPSFVVDVNVPN